MNRPDYRTVEAELVRRIGRERVSSSPEDKITHSYDASRLRGKPDLICRPESTEDVAEILKIASAHNAPVIARGAASGLTGGAVAEYGGIVMDFLRMNRILAIDEISGCAVVQPGVLVDDFQAALAAKNMFYAPDPGSSAYATIGGNIAENAGGMRAVKYGVTRDHVLAIKCVLANGSIISTGSKAHKCVAGFDLTRLICGSEGMLALIVEAAVKILPLPPFQSTVLAHFKSEKDALAAAARVTSEGVLPRALEFIDRKCIEVLTSQNTAAPLDKGAGAVILAETDGFSAESATADMALVCASLERHGAEYIVKSKNADERAAIWSARKTLASALYNIAPVKLNEDICVPRAALPEFVEKAQSAASENSLFLCNYGHVGDGNLHATIMLKDSKPETLAPAEELVEYIFKLALELGGTISGEHGIGITKRKYLGWEIGESEMALMRDIKNLFDPKGILNPGKQFPGGGLV